MKRHGMLILVVVAAVSASAPASAQRIEITPFAGYQFSGELAEIGDETTNRKLESGSSWGLMFDVDVTSDLQVELYYSSQNADLNRGTADRIEVGVDTFQIGAIREYAPRNAVNPYVGLTLGATRFDVAGGSDTQFSGTVALGLKMLVSDHAGFRFDARIMGSSTGSDAISCSDGLCIGYPDNSIIWRYAVNAGLIIHFGR
jgi:hypothetical protein